MKKLLLLTALLASFTCCWAAKQKTVKVKTSAELLRAIKSDTRIIVEKNLYDLTYQLENLNGYESDDIDQSGAYFTEEFDGPSLVVCNVNNVTIEGMAPDTHIHVIPRYADVIKFVSCNGITLKNLKLGHAVGSECSGNVLTLVEVTDMNIDNCKLYGCGVIGIDALDSKDIRVNDSEIYECSINSLLLNNVENLTFSNCTIYDNGGQIEVFNSQGIVFNNCSFHDNRLSFSHVDPNSTVTMNDCRINHKEGQGSKNITLNNCEAEFGEDITEDVEVEEYDEEDEQKGEYYTLTTPWDYAREALTLNDMQTVVDVTEHFTDDEIWDLSNRYYARAIALAKERVEKFDEEESKTAYNLLTDEPVTMKASDLMACKKVRSIQLEPYGTFIYNYFPCRIYKEGDTMIFHKTGGSQRKWGNLYRFDDLYVGFTGCYYIGGDQPTYFNVEKYLQTGLMRKTAKGKILMLLLDGQKFELLEFSK